MLMKFVKLIPVILLFLSGCVQPEVAPTLTPAVETPQVTVALSPTPTSTPSPTALEPVMYRIWIDSDYGFYRVRATRDDSTIELPSDFNILNFTINVGDSVRWINDDSYDFPVTVISNEGLFSNRTGLLRYQYDRFDYRFNERGTYMFSIREYPGIPNQTVLVK